MHLQTDLLLTAENLRRDSGIERGRSTCGVFALKRIASQTYLVVNELQAQVLAEFAAPKTVPQALESCIRERKCPALHEFYDLILKAHRAGILRSEELCTDGPAAILRPPVRWFAALKPRAVTLTVCFTALAGLAATFWHRGLMLPAAWPDLLAGWLVAGAVLSLGEVLAAAALRGAGCEVHHPHFRWRSVVPHFAVDQSDACMADRLGQATLHAAALFPSVIAAGVGLWLRAPWTFAPLAAVFLACRPFGASPLARLIGLLRRTPPVSTDGPPLFDAPRDFSEHLRLLWRRFDGRVAATQLATGLVWTLALGTVFYQPLHLRLIDVLRDWTLWERTLLGLAAACGCLVLLWLAADAQYRVADTVAAFGRRLRLAGRRWRPRPVLPDRNVDLVDRLIRANPLLGRLDPEVQLELALAFRPFQAGAWRTLAAFDREPPFVALVVSGRASVYRRLKSGRKTRFLRLMEGDLFGAHHLVDPDNPNLEIRTDTPLVALTIGLADFQRLVIDRLGAPAVCAYMHKHLFLQHCSDLCADWRPAAIARFVDLADTSSHAAGGRILARGQEVPSLYVLYEGHARAVDGRQRRAKLKPGDFFGEISLLQTSTATADVENRDDARCFVVNRLDFIRFMARNHHVALQMERLCSKRLGRPIFPLEHAAFHER